MDSIRDREKEKTRCGDVRREVVYESQSILVRKLDLGTMRVFVRVTE